MLKRYHAYYVGVPGSTPRCPLYYSSIRNLLCSTLRGRNGYAEVRGSSDNGSMSRLHRDGRGSIPRSSIKGYNGTKLEVFSSLI